MAPTEPEGPHSSLATLRLLIAAEGAASSLAVVGQTLSSPIGL
jgi:hypothetical protein